MYGLPRMASGLVLGAALAVAVPALATDTFQLVIPPGQERLLGAMVGMGDVVLPGRCRLKQATVLKSRVELTYLCEDPAAPVGLWLHPPGWAGKALGQTEKFVVAGQKGGVGPPEGLVDALVERLRAREAGWHWMRVRGETGEIATPPPSAPPPPAGQELEPRHITLYEQGLELYRTQRYAEAVDVFLALARENPRFSGVLGMVVANLAPTHPDAKAVAARQAAADAAPDDALSQFVAGVAAHYSAHYTAETPEQKRALYSQAIRYLDRTRPHLDFEPRVFIYLAVSHFRLGHQEDAERFIEQAVTISGNDPDAYYCRAEIFHRTDVERSLADLQTYLEMIERFRKAGGWVADEKVTLVRRMRDYLQAVSRGESELEEIFDPLAGASPAPQLRAPEAPAAAEPPPEMLQSPRKFGGLVLAVSLALGLAIVGGLYVARRRRDAAER